MDHGLRAYHKQNRRNEWEKRVLKWNWIQWSGEDALGGVREKDNALPCKHL